MDRKFAEQWLNNLKEAWWNKDIEKAISLFTKTTFYQETPFMKTYTTFEEIKQEWQHIKNQNIKNIEFKILAIDKNVLIVEWLFEEDMTAYDGIYEIKNNRNLYNIVDANPYPLNKLVRETNIRNGSSVIII